MSRIVSDVSYHDETSNCIQGERENEQGTVDNHSGQGQSTPVERNPIGGQEGDFGLAFRDILNGTTVVSLRDELFEGGRSSNKFERRYEVFHERR